MEKRQMKLGVFLTGVGHHVAAWRHPDAPAGGNLNIHFYKRLAQTAERGKFDLIFLADTLIVTEKSHTAELARFEPLTLLSALSVVTDNIGLAATASTTYTEPFNLARLFASLDHLSAGRAAWNVVTTSYPGVAQNFGKENHLPRPLRYEMAEEYVRAVKSLWDSWEDDAFVFDKSAGVYFDPDKLHVPNHKGKYYSVRGPLNSARPPQGYPVLIQAFASQDGVELAGRIAEVIFTVQHSLQEAKAFYSLIKEKVAASGRSPDHVKIMPGVFPVVGKTEQEAKDKYDQLQELILPSVGVALLSAVCGHDLSGYPLDGPFPDVPELYGSNSRFKIVADLARRDHLTIRQLYKIFAGARGHRVIVGTPEQIADQLEEWFVAEASDGFNVMPPILPNGLEDFVDLVVPELQRRGLFRREYEGRTLRENLGLPRPKNQFSGKNMERGDS